MQTNFYTRMPFKLAFPQSPYPYKSSKNAVQHLHAI